MSPGESQDIKKLQHNLPSLRRIAGWTAEDLGRKIGVTKQTISNLETGRTSLSKTQYIALRTVLDYEAKSNQNLERALGLVLDNKNATVVEQEANEDKVKAVAAAIAAGVSGAALGALLGAVSVTLGTWLAEIMDDDF